MKCGFRQCRCTPTATTLRSPSEFQRILGQVGVLDWLVHGWNLEPIAAEIRKFKNLYMEPGDKKDQRGHGVSCSFCALQGRRSQKVPHFLSLFRHLMDILISISELAYVYTPIMTQEYHLPTPLRHAPGTRNAVGTIALAGRGCGLVFIALCFLMRVVFSHARPSNKHNRLAGKNGNGNGRPLVPRHDMEGPCHLKKPDFIGLSGEPY